MKVVIDRCDGCKQSKSIILRCKDDKHHLCEDCVTDLLRAIIVPSKGRIIPYKDEEIAKCVFCELVTSKETKGAPYMIEFNTAENLWVCSNCLLEAAREMGTLRIRKDC